MALFGSNKTKSSGLLKRVRPTVVRTQNVAKELFKLAKSYEMEPDMLDFNLLDVQTYTRMINKNGEGEWEEVPNDSLYELDNDNSLLNPSFQIKQTYEIEMFSKNLSDDNVLKDMKLAVGVNATKCKVYLSIGANSYVKYTSQLEYELLTEINKRKVKAGILVNIFDEMVSDVASKITAHTRVAGESRYEKAETHLIAQGYEPTATTNDQLILRYEHKKEISENEKIDYAARGFIQSVKEGEVLIEYIKPKLGKPGRNCRGEFIQPIEPITKHEPTFQIGDNIKIVEDVDSIKYIAQENGYIALEDNTYIIRKDVGVDEISFKKTGSIESGVDSDVNIIVSEDDAIKDAIGAGMVVKVTELEVEGNVGSSAKVTAKKIKICGQTHRSSVIRADKVDINVHKGKAIGKNITITRLEHGSVYGDKVEISQAVGGDIRGIDVEIGICASHVKVAASKRIEIKKMQGSENTFTIDPVLQRDTQESIKNNEKKIKELEAEIKELKKDKLKYTHFIQDGKQAFLDIRKRLASYKKNGVKMPASFVKKYKQFQNLQLKYKNITEDLEKKQNELNLLTTRTASFQDNIFDARIINRDRWIGYNEIKFKLIDPPLELIYKPLEGSRDKIFGLVEVDDGEFAICPVSES